MWKTFFTLEANFMIEIFGDLFYLFLERIVSSNSKIRPNSKNNVDI